MEKKEVEKITKNTGYTEIIGWKQSMGKKNLIKLLKKNTLSYEVRKVTDGWVGLYNPKK